MSDIDRSHDSEKEVINLESDHTQRPGHLKGISPREGRVGAIETLGAVDGPGLRTVVFMQGCPLRCKYCHNIDMAQHWPAPKYSAQRLFDEVIKNKPYWQKYDYNDLGSAVDMKHIPGGVTFSGGEPTIQTDFLVEVFKLLKAEGVHIAIDTCLFTSKQNIDKLFPFVDLWMVSVKQLDSAQHQKLTGVPNHLIMENFAYLDGRITDHRDEDRSPKIRVRFVLIPSVVSSEEYIDRLGDFANGIANLELFELLPYSEIGKQKWIDIYGEYGMEGIDEPDEQLISATKGRLEQQGIQVKV